MFFGQLGDAFLGTILSSTLRAGPSTSEVKRHKVLSTSKSLALFCSGLVILLANERSYKRVQTAFPLLEAAAETTCGCSSLKSSHRHRHRVAGVAHSYSDVRQTASVSTTEAAAYIHE